MTVKIHTILLQSEVFQKTILDKSGTSYFSRSSSPRRSIFSSRLSGYPSGKFLRTSLLPRGVSEFETQDGEEGPGVLGLAWTATKLAGLPGRNNCDDVTRFKLLQRAAHLKDLQIR